VTLQRATRLKPYDAIERSPRLLENGGTTAGSASRGAGLDEREEGKPADSRKRGGARVRVRSVGGYFQARAGSGS
jgi:hypothetical protein